MVKRIARLGSPTFLVLALGLFLLPFLSVSCDTPGGYGRAAPGGTTEYTGLDLAIGTSPSVDSSHIRAPEERQDDDLGFQPLVALAAIGIVAALAAVLARPNHGVVVAVVAATSAVVLLVAELVARSKLVDKVAAQSTEPFAPGKSAADHVAIGPGFWLACAATLIAAALAAIGARVKPMTDDA